MAMRDGAKPLRRRVAANIKARRLACGWSQEVLAHEAKFHRTFIGQVERCESNISIDNLERISSALGVDVCALICSPREPKET